MSDISILIDQIRTALNVTEAHLTDEEILTAISDAYKEVSVKGSCVEETLKLVALPGRKIIELPRTNVTWSPGQISYPLKTTKIFFIIASSRDGELMPEIFPYAWNAGEGRQDYDPSTMSLDNLMPVITGFAEKV